jgi:hypothetical protein
LCPATHGLAASRFPRRPWTETFSSPLLATLPSNLQQQRPDPVFIAGANLLSSAVLVPVIVSSALNNKIESKALSKPFPIWSEETEDLCAPQATSRNAKDQDLLDPLI